MNYASQCNKKGCLLQPVFVVIARMETTKQSQGLIVVTVGLPRHLILLGEWGSSQ